MTDPNVVTALRRIEAHIATADADGDSTVNVDVADLRDWATALRRASVAVRDTGDTT